MKVFFSGSDKKPEEVFRLNRGEIKDESYQNKYCEFLETIIGTIYLDGGLDEDKEVILLLLIFDN